MPLTRKGRVITSLIFAAILLLRLAVELYPVVDIEKLWKRHHYESVAIEAVINPDGSIDYKEDRTFVFTGNFTFAFYYVDLDEGKDVADFQVWEGATRLVESAAKTPGTVEIEESDERVHAKWYFSPGERKRTFTIKYRVLNEVGNYADTAEFYRQLVGDGWPEWTDKVTADIYLPEGLSRDQIKAWGHGPLNGRVEVVNERQAHFEVAGLPSGKGMSARIAFPHLAMDLRRTDRTKTRLQEILADEARFAAETNATRERFRKANTAAAVIPILIFMGGALVWFLYGRQPMVVFDARYLREPPYDYEPAIVGYLWRNGKSGVPDLVATMLDLVRRDVVRMRQLAAKTAADRPDIEFIKVDAGDSLSSFERMAITYIFDTIAVSRTVTVSDIRRFADYYPGRIRRFFKRWSSEIAAEAGQYDLVDDVNSYWVAANALLGCLAIVIGLVFLEFAVASGVVGMIIGAIQAAMALLMRRRTPAGTLHFLKWSAFRRFLSHFSQMRAAIPLSIVIWERYLIYAVSLGVAGEVLRQLKLNYIGCEDQWEFAGNMPVWLSWPDGFQAMGSFVSTDLSFGNMVDLVTGDVVSGSGAGGGFAGGGVGGGGGGGGGGAG